MGSLQGHLLVATPRLPDENFSKTVALLVQHNEQGALGLVLNRPSGETVDQLWQRAGEGTCPSQQHVHLGGPVSGPLMAIHTAEHLGELKIMPGIFFSADRDHLDALVRQQDHQYRLFLGHSGWGAGQLEGELEYGAWLTTPATIEYIFHEEENLWEMVARHIGNSLLIEALRIKETPEDPSMN